MASFSPGMLARYALILFAIGIALIVYPILPGIGSVLVRIGFLLGALAYVWDALRFWYYGNWWFSILMIALPLFITLISFRASGPWFSGNLVFSVLPWVLGVLLILYLLNLLNRAIRPRSRYESYRTFIHEHPSIPWALAGLVAISGLCLLGSLYRDDPSLFVQGPAAWISPFVEPLVIQPLDGRFDLFGTLFGRL